jgi:hypothetical protein
MSTVKQIYFLLFFFLLFIGCKKAEIKVHKKDNHVVFKLTSNIYDAYTIGYSDSNNGITFKALNIDKNNSASWSTELKRNGQYFFSVQPDPVYLLNRSFTMEMFVNDKLYKSITVVHPLSSYIPYVISGTLVNEY